MVLSIYTAHQYFSFNLMFPGSGSRNNRRQSFLLTDLVTHGPGRVDQAPVGRTRDPVVGPPLVPVGEGRGGEA